MSEKVNKNSSFGKRNKIGERILELTEAYDLDIANTVFKEMRIL